MSKRIDHLDIIFPRRGWLGENSYDDLQESSGAWVSTQGGYPFVLVGSTATGGDDGSSIIMSVEEATRLKDALVEALARIGHMRPSITNKGETK